MDLPHLDTTGWYALGIPAYAAVVWIEARFSRGRGFSVPEAVSNLSAGLGTLLIGLFVGPWLYAAWDRVATLSPLAWPDHGPWRFPLALVGCDLCYYLWHRAGHRFALLWTVHGIHHQHEHLNSTVGLRLEWLADPTAALFFGILPLLGVPAEIGFAAIAVLSAYTLTAHMPVLPRRSFGLLVTPAIHGAHHSRDARGSDANFGAMLTVWDRLFGTLWEPDRPLQIDVPNVCRRHDGVRTQWSLIREQAEALAGLPWRERLRVLLSPPVVRDEPTPRTDIPATVERRALLAFALAVPAATLVLFAREAQPVWVRITVAALTIWALTDLGGILDDRPGVPVAERLRAIAALLVAGALLPVSPPLAGATLLAGVGAAVNTR